MKLFNKEELKNKVGRPKLADTELKKKSLIISGIMLLVSIVLLAGGLISLNILPRFNKLKGAVTCASIPTSLQYNASTNPNGFKDINFYSAVVNAYNSNTNYCTSMDTDKLATITSLSASNKNITDESGIQYLTSLTSLILQNNQLNSIDLSHNTALTMLELYNNNLSSIDISHNTSLTYLSLGKNQLNSIDISHNTSLTYLNLNNNQLSSVDLSNNTALTKIYLSNNQLSSIDLSHNTALTMLDLYDNQLNSIDLSHNTALTNLSLSNNNLSGSLTLENLNTSGEHSFHLSNNNLSSITLKNINANTIELDNNNLAEIKLNNVSASSLKFNNNSISNIDLSDFTFNSSYGNTLDLSNNNISTIDLTDIDFKGIYGNAIDLSNNNISTIDLSNLNNLSSLDISNNNFEYNKKYNVKLGESIDIQPDIITPSDKTTYYSDSIAKIENGKITGLLPGNTTLRQIFDYGPNHNLIEQTATINVTAEEYDDAYAKAGFTNKKLYTCAIKSMNENLSERTYLPESALANITSLDCSNQGLTEVNDLNKLPNLSELNLSNNNIESIDLNGLNSLYSVYLNNNKLTSIKLPESEELEDLYLSNNNLSSIDISKNPDLDYLFIDNNKLTSIDVSNNTNLSGLFLSHNKISEIKHAEHMSLDALLLHDNKIEKIDMNNIGTSVMTLQNNPISDTIYMIKGDSINYGSRIGVDDISTIANEDVPDLPVEVENSEIIEYKLGIIKALKEGNSKIELFLGNGMYDDYADLMIASETGDMTEEEVEQEYQKLIEKYGSEEALENAPTLSQYVKVYDITSNVYKVDKDKKTIDVSGMDLDASKITITSDGLKGKVEKDKFVIYDGDKKAVTYDILNMKKEEVKPSNNNSTNNNVKTDTKTTTKKNSRIRNIIKKVFSNDDIKLNGTFVSSLALNQIKGTNRNIIVTNEDVTFTINGKDIEKIEGNINLDYKLEKDNNKVRLIFNKESKLPSKMLIEINTNNDKFKDIKHSNINIYRNKDGKLELVAEDLSINNNKLRFYVDTMGEYVIQSKEEKEVKINKVLVEENKKANRNYIPFIIILIIISLSIIGYITYKKKHN